MKALRRDLEGCANDFSRPKVSCLRMGQLPASECLVSLGSIGRIRKEFLIAQPPLRGRWYIDVVFAFIRFNVRTHFGRRKKQRHILP